MMSRIESMDGAGILAWHPDRLARNSIDGGRIIYAVTRPKLFLYAFRHFGLNRPRKGYLCFKWRSDNQSIILTTLSKMLSEESAKKCDEASGLQKDPVAISIIQKPETLSPIRCSRELLSKHLQNSPRASTHFHHYRTFWRNMVLSQEMERHLANLSRTICSPTKHISVW